MLNYWWVTRPKRKLNSIPEVLAQFAELSLNQEWDGQRDKHLAYEDALEKAGLKRAGDRRDHTGGGGRTYKAWLLSLGLIFVEKSTGKLRLTLAGEAIMNGASPVKVLTGQILKYQFPSQYSIGRGVNVSPRFKIHPFIFLFKLLMDKKIMYLTKEEIAKIVITEAETDKDSCLNYIVQRILEYRENGDSCLEDAFFQKYKSSKGEVNPAHPFSHLIDVADTMINWLEYTQLVIREEGKVIILPDKIKEVEEILKKPVVFIDRPSEHEYFQRKYGIDPEHKKDTRNLRMSRTITAEIIARQKIIQAFIGESLKRPITSINAIIVDSIADTTGIKESLVEEVLLEKYQHGAIGAFMTKYFEMAFSGKKEATEFEKATAELFQDVFEFKVKHVGSKGLTPDILLDSETCKYQAIIDNKAYSRYTISNDHHNRMVYNYINDFGKYAEKNYGLAFFTYIAGGFGKNIDQQIRKIVQRTGVNGSVITVSKVIDMVENVQKRKYTHDEIRKIFSVNRQVLLKDLNKK